jgi:hypothetical protein
MTAPERLVTHDRSPTAHDRHRGPDGGRDMR